MADPQSSREHVALELMKIIAERDLQNINEKTSNRKAYFLKLYAECYQVVDTGEAPEADE